MLKKSVWLTLTIMALAFIAGAAIAASYSQVNLRDLVQDAELIALAERVPSASPKTDSARVASFRILKIIKSASKSVPSVLRMCGGSAADESTYDYSQIKGQILVFAKRKDGCYRPLKGRVGIVGIREAEVVSQQISDQEDLQGLNIFIEKIEAIKKEKGNSATLVPKSK